MQNFDYSNFDISTIPGLFLPKAFFKNMAEMSLSEIGYVVANTLLGRRFDSAAIKRLVDYAFCYAMPLSSDFPGFYRLDCSYGPNGHIDDAAARLSGAIADLVAAETPETSPHKVKIVVCPRDIPVGQAKAYAGAACNAFPVIVDAPAEKCRAVVERMRAENNVPRGVELRAVNNNNVGRIIALVIMLFHGYAGVLRLRRARSLRNVAFEIDPGIPSLDIAVDIARKMDLWINLPEASESALVVKLYSPAAGPVPASQAIPPTQSALMRKINQIIASNVNQ